jgi:hypothetical protein
MVKRPFVDAIVVSPNGVSPVELSLESPEDIALVKVKETNVYSNEQRSPKLSKRTWFTGVYLGYMILHFTHEEPSALAVAQTPKISHPTVVFKPSYCE